MVIYCLSLPVSLVNRARNGADLLTVSGSHGSHVASIIASQHKDQPELNGVAPGVEIVSLRIGDPRVSGMETHQALLRASKAIIDSGCDIASQSFCL